MTTNPHASDSAEEIISAAIAPDDPHWHLPCARRALAALSKAGLVLVPRGDVEEAAIERGVAAMRQAFADAKDTSVDGAVPYSWIVKAVLRAALEIPRA